MKSWEDICNNCGLCCHEKVVLPKALIIDIDKCCEFYDKDEHRCSAYEKRFKVCTRCRKVTPFMAMFSPSLPEVCGYVQFMRRLRLRFVPKREFVLSNLD